MESLRDIDPAAFARYMRAKHGESCGEADGARLLAAAPDLLAALERAEQMLSDWQHTLSARGARVDPLLNEARAAIARAKGGV